MPILYAARMSDATEILEAALRLDPAERTRLLEAISESLDGAELGDGWEAEISRRMADVDAGRVQTIPGDEVFDRLRQRFGGK